MKINGTAFFMFTGLILTFAFSFSSCNNTPYSQKGKQISEFIEKKGDHVIKNAVKDIDGNSYDAVKLGNHAALNELCPKGWHVPSCAEWDELERYCMRTPKYKCGNSDTYIAKALADSIGWKYYIHPEPCEYNNIAYNPLTTNNATGFSARGCGIAHGYDNKEVYFDYEEGERAYFWTSDLEGDPADDKMCFRVLMAEEAILGHGEYVSLGDWQINTTSYEISNYGLSVRCVKN